MVKGFNQFIKLDERLGVPEGINEQAVELRKKMIEAIAALGQDQIDAVPPRTPTDIRLFKHRLKFKDVDLDGVSVNLEVIVDPTVPTTLLQRASYGSPAGVVKSKKSFAVRRRHDKTNIGVSVIIKPGTPVEEIARVIDDKLDNKTIAHEIMHFYEGQKSPGESVSSMISYRAASESGQGAQILYDFAHLLYYTHAVESVVRPTEVYQELLDKGVTRENFKKLMQESDIVQTTNRARTFSLDSLMEELNRDPEVAAFLEEAESQGYKRIGTNAEDALNLMFIRYANRAIDSLQKQMQFYVMGEIKNFFDFALAQLGAGSKEIAEREKEADAFGKKVSAAYLKYRDRPLDFFRKLEKKIRRDGTEVWKRIHKLYGMLPPSGAKNESIDWVQLERLPLRSVSVKK